MLSLVQSSILWRIVGGFAFGTVLTLGLGAMGESPPPPMGTPIEVIS